VIEHFSQRRAEILDTRTIPIARLVAVVVAILAPMEKER